MWALTCILLSSFNRFGTFLWIPWDFLCSQSCHLGIGSVLFLHFYSAKLLSRFSRARLCATPETAAHQALPSPGFSRQNTGVGCHFLLQFLLYMPFNSFSCLITLLELSGQCWSVVVRVDNCVLFLILRGEAFIFIPLTIVLAVGYFVDAH